MTARERAAELEKKWFVLDDANLNEKIELFSGAVGLAQSWEFPDLLDEFPNLVAVLAKIARRDVPAALAFFADRGIDLFNAAMRVEAWDALIFIEKRCLDALTLRLARLIFPGEPKIIAALQRVAPGAVVSGERDKLQEARRTFRLHRWWCDAYLAPWFKRHPEIAEHLLEFAESDDSYDEMYASPELLVELARRGVILEAENVPQDAAAFREYVAGNPAYVALAVFGGHSAKINRAFLEGRAYPVCLAREFWGVLEQYESVPLQAVDANAIEGLKLAMLCFPREKRIFDLLKVYGAIPRMQKFVYEYTRIGKARRDFPLQNCVYAEGLLTAWYASAIRGSRETRAFELALSDFCDSPENLAIVRRMFRLVRLAVDESRDLMERLASREFTDWMRQNGELTRLAEMNVPSPGMRTDDLGALQLLDIDSLGMVFDAMALLQADDPQLQPGAYAREVLIQGFIPDTVVPKTLAMSPTLADLVLAASTDNRPQIGAFAFTATDREWWRAIQRLRDPELERASYNLVLHRLLDTTNERHAARDALALSRIVGGPRPSPEGGLLTTRAALWLMTRERRLTLEAERDLVDADASPELRQYVARKRAYLDFVGRMKKSAGGRALDPAPVRYIIWGFL